MVCKYDVEQCVCFRSTLGFGKTVDVHDLCFFQFFWQLSPVVLKHGSIVFSAEILSLMRSLIKKRNALT